MLRQAQAHRVVRLPKVRQSNIEDDGVDFSEVGRKGKAQKEKKTESKKGWNVMVPNLA